MTQEQAERRHTLCQLLARNREEFDIEYGGYLSNHMSHYLVALFKLGASPERLQKAYTDYSTETKLEPSIPPTVVISTDTWHNFIGKKTHYLDLFEFFRGELERHGVRTVLRKYVPQLLEGVCGSAFHGVIQLGYALEVMDVPNIAEGLAYWTYSFYSLGTPSSVEKRTRQASVSEPASALRSADVIALLDRLRLDTHFDAVFTEPEKKKLGFQKRLHLLATEHLSNIEPYDLDLAPFIMAGEPGASTTRRDRIEALVDLFTLSAIKVFASSGYLYFFVLHLVTSFRALKVSLKAMCMDDNEEEDDKVDQNDVSEEEALIVATALEFFWRAVVCAYIAVDRPTVSDIDPQALKRDEAEAEVTPSRQEGTHDASTTLPAALQGWDDVVQAAIPNHDEHLVKLVFVCWTEAHEPEARKRGPEWNEYFLHAAANTVLRFHHNWRH